MPTLSLTRILVQVSSFLLFVAPVFAADPAEACPRDAMLFAGWSRLIEPESELHRSSLRAGEACRFWAEKSDDDELRTFAEVIDIGARLAAGSGSLSIQPISVTDGPPALDAALVISDVPGPEILAGRLRALMEKAESKFEPVVIGAANLVACDVPDMPGKFYLGTAGPRIVMGFGEAAIKRILGVLEKSADSLVKDAEFVFDRQKTEGGSIAAGVEFFLRVPAIVGSVETIVKAEGDTLPPNFDKILAETGIAAMKSAYWRHVPASGSADGRLFLHTDPNADMGLLKFFRQKPIKLDDLAAVPKSALWTIATTLDLHGLYVETMRVVNSLAPEASPEIDAAMAGARQLVGFSITDDFLPMLGQDWLAFDAPDHGTWLVSGAVLAIRPKDAGGFSDMLMRFYQMLTPLAAQENVDLLHHTTTYGGREIHYLLAGGIPIPVAPAWTFIDNRAVFGLFPQTVAAALRQFDAKTRGPSLLEQDDVKAALARWPKNLDGFSFIELQQAARALHPFLVMAGTALTSLGAKSGAKIDLTFPQPLPDWLPNIRNLVAGSWHEPDGIHAAYTGNGTLTTATILAAPALTASIMLPSLGRARELAKRSVSAANLRAIGMACHMHAQQHQNAFPPNFDTLLKAGILTEKMLESPRLPSGVPAYVYIAGQSLASDPQNVLAYERQADEEGTNVLFVDGHAEWIPGWRLADVIRATFRRLNRESELPAEFRETDATAPAAP